MFMHMLQTVQDCVLYYYLSKMNANYKQMVRRHLSKRRTKLQKVNLLETYLSVQLTLWGVCFTAANGPIALHFGIL